MSTASSSVTPLRSKSPSKSRGRSTSAGSDKTLSPKKNKDEKKGIHNDEHETEQKDKHQKEKEEYEEDKDHEDQDEDNDEDGDEDDEDDEDDDNVDDDDEDEGKPIGKIYGVGDEEIHYYDLTTDNVYTFKKKSGKMDPSTVYDISVENMVQRADPDGKYLKNNDGKFSFGKNIVLSNKSPSIKRGNNFNPYEVGDDDVVIKVVLGPIRDITQSIKAKKSIASRDYGFVYGTSEKNCFATSLCMDDTVVGFSIKAGVEKPKESKVVSSTGIPEGVYMKTFCHLGIPIKVGKHIINQIMCLEKAAGFDIKIGQQGPVIDDNYIWINAKIPENQDGSNVFKKLIKIDNKSTAVGFDEIIEAMVQKKISFKGRVVLSFKTNFEFSKSKNITQAGNLTFTILDFLAISACADRRPTILSNASMTYTDIVPDNNLSNLIESLDIKRHDKEDDEDEDNNESGTKLIKKKATKTPMKMEGSKAKKSVKAGSSAKDDD